MNLSKYNNVFCDSKKALEWAYKHGLPRDSQVRTSAPALLWEECPNIEHIESRWNVEELRRFQSSIQRFSEDVFDAAIAIKGVERELALAIAQSAVSFQKVLYKAACLKEEDFTNPRLFIQVKGEGGPSGNNMNSPWKHILSCNKLFNSVSFTLKNDKWSVLNTQVVSYWDRYKLAGVETLIYRLLILVMRLLPSWIFKRELLVPNENELIIETAASLMLRGVKVTELNVEHVEHVVDEDLELDACYKELYNSVSIVMQERVGQWVVLSAVDPTMSMFKAHISKHFKLFNQLVKAWKQTFTGNNKTKQAVLMNASGGIKGQTLSYVCNKIGVPVIGAQHGVTVEISQMHGEVSIGFENSVPKATLYYNSKCAEVESRSYFSNSKSYVVGSSSRHVRMKSDKVLDEVPIPIVYISTNLYRGNLGQLITWHTDYDRAKKERDFVTKVLRNLPHKILYKTYPEDNRRYADKDPILNDVEDSNNITLFDKKVDVRYLLSNYKIIITSGATSTLSWPVMSEKPVVFINRKEKSPLTSEAHAYLSKGLFVFDDDEKDFHGNLIKFLSQPISYIEAQWEEKRVFRKDMIKNYFSEYKGDAGKRAAKIILKEYLI
jgi:hypothetical protein